MQYCPLASVLEMCQSVLIVTTTAGPCQHLRGRSRDARSPAVHSETVRPTKNCPASSTIFGCRTGHLCWWETCFLQKPLILKQTSVTSQHTVRPHLTSSIGSAVLREITCSETSVTTGKLVSTRVTFLWHLIDIITKRR